MVVYLPAQQPALHPDGRRYTWMYETRNETRRSSGHQVVSRGAAGHVRRVQLHGGLVQFFNHELLAERTTNCAAKLSGFACLRSVPMKELGAAQAEVGNHFGRDAGGAPVRSRSARDHRPISVHFMRNCASSLGDNSRQWRDKKEHPAWVL
jgi:hypothetical protein